MFETVLRYPLLYNLYRGLLKLNELYESIGYSVTSLSGHSSISFDYSNALIPSSTFEPFDLPLYNRWSECLTGGIVELLDLNFKQDLVNCYDINGLYSYVRLVYDYPTGKPVEYENVDPTQLDNYFGLVKAYVYDDNKSLIGVPCKIGSLFNRYRGYIHFNGTTEFLKELVQQGVRVVRIYSILHYPSKRSGKELFGKSIALFDSIKQEGSKEGNQGKRAFGKLSPQAY